MNRALRAGALIALVLTAPVRGQQAGDPAAGLARAAAEAESRLAAGDLPEAQRLYRGALFEGLVLLGTLERLDGHYEPSRQALSRAAAYVPDDPKAALALASEALQAGDAAQAVAVLEAHGGAVRDLETTRVLARAYASADQHDAALRTLQQGLAAAPDDPEVAYVIAGEYLWLKQVDAAERLLASVIERRPLALTHVLVGRAWRDAGEYERAERELRRALEIDPKVRRAHYYLGTVAASDPAPARQEAAIAEFREELRISGEDAVVLDQLGVTLVEAGRAEEAVPVLERALAIESRSAYAYDLGRAQLAAQKPAAAVESLRRALQLALAQGGGESELERIHYQLGVALRRAGSEAEAVRELGEARTIAARWTDASRRVTTLGRSGSVGSRPGAASASAEASPLARVPQAARRELAAGVRSALAQCYLNLGVIETRRDDLKSAAGLFEAAAGLDPAFPAVQQALGVARFNTGEFDKAIEPLQKASAADASNPVLRRLLAIAWLNTGASEKAVPLLVADPELRSDPQLRLALGMAYKALGKADLAAEQFKAYQELTGTKPF
ncbi:MAG TPA: tetratricopeptide repeat protein [Vicinamibacteria bacterium]